MGTRCGEFGNSADVVEMEMGDEHVIDAGDAGVAHGLLNAGGVALHRLSGKRGGGEAWIVKVVAPGGPAGVDQQGRAGG